MLSFQVQNSGRTVQIHCDDDGICHLINALTKLRGSGSHIHLWAPSCGGRDLADTTPFGETAVGEVIINHGGDQVPD
jgi:hypothetical protein